VSVQPGRVGLGATPLFQIRPYIDLHNGFTTALSVRSSLHVVKWGGGRRRVPNSMWARPCERGVCKVQHTWGDSSSDLTDWLMYLLLWQLIIVTLALILRISYNSWNICSKQIMKWKVQHFTIIILRIRPARIIICPRIESITSLSKNRKYNKFVQE